MKNEELDDLIDGYLEGRLDKREAATLSELLESSADARSRYWEVASVHGLLEQALQRASINAATGTSSSYSTGFSRLFQWRALYAAAAGLVFGIFGATVVWAYALPVVNGPAREKLSLFFESFEGEGIQPNRRFPTRSGEWFGDLAVVTSDSTVVPFKGDHMAKFTPVATRKFSYARQIIDLADQALPEQGQTCQLEVVAAFTSGDSAVPSRYQIRLAAFSQAPSDVRPIWNDEAVLFDTVLQHTGRNVVTEPGEGGWKKIRVSLDVPPGTRSLVISLGAASADGSLPDSEHYLDAVRADLVLTGVTED